MKLRESVRIAWRSITGHKLRSTLTTLGVIIGIASVITFMIMGGAFEENVLGDIQADNDPIVTVSTQTDPPAGTGIVPVDAPIYSESDVEALEGIDGVEYVAPEAERAVAQVRHDGASRSAVSVQATDPRRFEQDGLYAMQDGETFSGPNETVITTGLAQSYEENVSVGEEIEITFDDGTTASFTVAGIVEQDVGGQGGGVAFVSLSEYYSVSIETPRGTTEAAYPTLEIRTETLDDVDPVKEAASEYLDTESDASELKEDDHRIEVQTLEDQIDQFTAIVDQLRNFVVGIAAISLVVGSIGIANIMIVSVTERTREIGIMKAVGARKRDVVQLFLVESVILGAIGAVFGVLLGVGLGYLATSLTEWPMVYPLDWILIAVAVGVGVGVLSGLYPAWSAARVDPIEALRRE